MSTVEQVGSIITTVAAIGAFCWVMWVLARPARPATPPADLRQLTERVASLTRQVEALTDKMSAVLPADVDQDQP